MASPKTNGDLIYQLRRFIHSQMPVIPLTTTTSPKSIDSNDDDLCGALEKFILETSPAGCGNHLSSNVAVIDSTQPEEVTIMVEDIRLVEMKLAAP